ncbi:type II secretory pathway component PulF-like protein [Burkholderia aenigmatica]|uniref:type II secretory pathway component PulF-like protein n=1 Tax=Burkholderia aenigmatica TaxID=2015348 RepID=UPI002656640E|nr:type II secretory pathway component PulF-like protein [Burkholderia aenigmatica]MDN7880130.1 type II secretory pathway component PulF-like protein [Burkholderia aenigmatica]
MRSFFNALKQPFTDPLFFTKMKFRSVRAELYNDLAESMEAEPGTRITKFLTRYAERYPKLPKGKMAQHWLTRFREEGTFADAIRGTVPKEDMGAIAIAEESGDLRVGLASLAESISGLDSTKEAMLSVFGATFMVGLAVQFYIGLYSFKIVPQIEKAMPPNMTIEEIGTTAVWGHNMSFAVRNFWPLWLAFLIGVVALSVWAVPNYVGKLRRWLDHHVIYFQLYREFQASSFLTSLAAVTKRINNRVLPVPQALQMMEEDASPWIRWHIRRVLINMENNAEGKGENFNTGMTSPEMHYRMIDIAEYADMADMLDHVGKTILKRTPKEMEKRANRVQFIARVIMVVTVFGISAGFYKFNFDFQEAVTINAYTR